MAKGLRGPSNCILAPGSSFDARLKHPVRVVAPVARRPTIDKMSRPGEGSYPGSGSAATGRLLALQRRQRQHGRRYRPLQRPCAVHVIRSNRLAAAILPRGDWGWFADLDHEDALNAASDELSKLSLDGNGNSGNSAAMWGAFRGFSLDHHDEAPTSRATSPATSAAGSLSPDHTADMYPQAPAPHHGAVAQLWQQQQRQQQQRQRQEEGGEDDEFAEIVALATAPMPVLRLPPLLG